MVWSKEDFVREVQRQLVEMASIRRKIAAEMDAGGASAGPGPIEDSLDRLEESQNYILRKLECYVDETVDAQGDEPTMPGSIQAYIQLLLSEPALLQQLASQSTGDIAPSSEPSAAVVILGIGGKVPKRFEGPGGTGGGPFPQPYSLN